MQHSIEMSGKKDQEDAYHRHNHQIQEQQTFIHHQHQVPQDFQVTTTTVHQQQAPEAVMMADVPSLGPVYATGYSKITSVCLGFLQICICCLSIASGTVAIIFKASGSEDGTGFWCGAIYGIAGSIAVAAGFKPLNDLIIGAMVLSSVAIGFGITQLTLSILNLINMLSCGGYICVTKGAAAVISTVAMGTYGFWEMFFGLCLVVVGLRAVCCPPKSQTLVAPPLPSVTMPLTSATVWNHITAPGSSTPVSGYEGLRLEQEEAAASASYAPLHPQSKFKN